MKLSDARQAYRDLSGIASTVARQLAFAGIALVWLFRSSNGAAIALPADLRMPTALLIVALALDLLQYAIGALIWGSFARIHEKRKDCIDDSMSAPGWLNWPSLAFFSGKILCVSIANILLLRYALSSIAFG